MARDWKIILLAIIAILGKLVSGANNNTTVTVNTTTTTVQESTEQSTIDDSHFLSSSTTTEPQSPEPIQCGTKTLTDQSGGFTSPLYPKDYHNNLMCTWHIKVKKGMKVELIISTIDIEFGLECEFDVLEVFDGPSTDSDRIAQICSEGGTNRSVIRSTSNWLTVTFNSDGSERFGGFRAGYVAKSCFNEQILKTKGDEKWFNVTDEKKASRVKKALSGSGKVYTGLSTQNVTFHIEGKKKFELLDVSFRTKYASEIIFTFDSKDKVKASSKSVKKTDKWTLTKESYNKKIENLSITFVWNNNVKDRKAKKINVKDLLLTACLD